MWNKPSADDLKVIKEYLDKNGYSSVDEWAEDSDMTWDGGSWLDSNGNEIDPYEYLVALIMEMGL